MRSKGKNARNAPGNTEKPKSQKFPPLHIAATISYDFKGPLQFYNNEQDTVEKPRRPLKPRKSKYEDWETANVREQQ